MHVKYEWMQDMQWFRFSPVVVTLFIFLPIPNWYNMQQM